MEILNKKQITEKLGKFSFFSGKGGNAIINQVKYLGGITPFDEMIENGKIDPKISLDISFGMRPNGLELLLIHGFSAHRIGLEYEKINYWSFEPQEIIKERKSKSVVGRALLGGILLGPVGAIFGGMSGIGDKDISISLSGIDNILSISYTGSTENEKLLLFDCSKKNAKKVLEYFNKNFSEIFKKAVKESPQEENQSISLADELIKLRGLLNEGILTQEEFDLQKEKLLKK